MAVSIEDIKKLRNMTGAGMMDCKSALAETNGDIDAAIEIIRKKGQAVAAKRQDRSASEGCVLSAVKPGFGAIVALKCETDFVARNSSFVQLTKDILEVAMNNNAKTTEELMGLMIGDRTVAEKITDEIGKTGEKMELGAYECIEAPTVAAYDHLGNKLATIVGLTAEGVDAAVGREVAMQVAAMNPIAANREDVPAEIVEQELKIGREKAREEGKPEAILDKIAEGRLGKFYKESVLMEQEYHRDAKLTVAQYLDSEVKGMKVTSFKRVNLNAD
ncbi:MAG: elongation factor Ts [Muribaculaceae bacterium]|jgi:elongation factor Ts|nr:elongation factor Ts [Muribaculaceae bacterium]MBQ2370343.1 elongation factor Ts [Muribaculaceae bacterium]MBQ2398725.1 elongation factor Ts [Muribaculaceae bacterium]MBQ2440324.1 elongation factor Ts [Muribaculaceae bacterium]MBQ5724194.1 elongation factor Ts [Muribaculaceae bacterium]